MRVLHSPALLVCLSLPLATTREQSPQPASSPTLDAVEPLVEELFIAYAVYDVYANWPTPKASATIAEQIAEHKRSLAGLSDRAWTVAASELAILVDQTEIMLDLYGDFVDNNSVVRQAVSELQSKEGQNFMWSMVAEVAAADAMKAHPLIFAIAAIPVIIEYVSRSQNLREAEKKLLRERQEFLTAEMRSRANYFSNTMRLMAQQREWASSDVDFSANAIRTRDPLQTIERTLESLPSSAAPTAIESAANTCVQAARLIPSEEAYSAFKLRAWSEASRLAALAASSEWFATSHRLGGPLSLRGVDICRSRLSACPDFDDHGKYQLSKCLYFSGQREEALDWALRATKLRDNPSFAYDLACLLSINNRQHQALHWLQESFDLGIVTVEWAREGDPDLQGLRDALPEEFASLFDVKWSWYLARGLFRHDAVLHNSSHVPLTDVVFRPTITRGRLFGASGVGAPLKLSYLGPGQYHTFAGVFTDWPAVPSIASLVSSETPGKTSASGQLFSPVYKIVVHNKCDRPLRIAVRYADIAGTWHLEKWWHYLPGSRGELRMGYEERMDALLTRSAYVYFYAETTDDGPPLVWRGDGEHSFMIGGSEYFFRELVDRSEDTEIILTCK